MNEVWIYPGVEILEFLDFGPFQARPTAAHTLPKHLVPDGVLEHHPREEDYVLEFRGWKGEETPFFGSVEKQLLQRQTVIFGAIVAQYQLIVGVNVDQPAGFSVVAEVILLGRWLRFALLLHAREAGGGQHFAKDGCVTAVDQQIEIVFACLGSRDRCVALPMAVGDAVVVQSVDDVRDQPQRGGWLGHERTMVPLRPRGQGAWVPLFWAILPAAGLPTVWCS